MPRDLAQLPAPPWPGGKEPPPSAFSLLEPQLQLFVELYRETGDPMASAVRAKMFSAEYPIDVLARKTLEREDVLAAIIALDERESEAVAAVAEPAVPKQPVVVTRDTVTANLQDVYEQALGAKAFGAAIASQKTIASLNGWLKQTVDVNIGFKRAEDLSDEELERIAKAGGKRTMDGEFKDITPEDDGA